MLKYFKQRKNKNEPGRVLTAKIFYRFTELTFRHFPLNASLQGIGFLHYHRNFIQKIIKTSLRACLHGGGGPQVGEVTRFGGVTRLFI